MNDMTPYFYQYQVSGVFTCIWYKYHVTEHSTCRQTVEINKLKSAPIQEEASPFQLHIHPSVPRNERNYWY